MTATNNFSIHDDISARFAFFGINLALYLVRLHLTATTEYCYIAQFGTAVFWLAALVCLPPTPFVKDIKEFVLLDAIIYLCISIIYFLPNNLYTDNYQGIVFYQTALNTLYLVRLGWPCRDERQDYVGWPTFGLIGVFLKITGRNTSLPKRTKHQTVLGYGAICTACLIGYGLYFLEIKNSGVTGYFILTFFILFICKKSMAAHKARVAAQTAQQASERAQAERNTRLQMQNNLDTQLTADTLRSKTEAILADLAHAKAEKAALIAKIAELEALQTPEAKRFIEALLALPAEAQQSQIRVVEAMKGEMDYFDAKE